ncbi:hypothetical protein ACWFR7_31185, partial [Streptomyces sp. NPDC055210]
MEQRIGPNIQPLQGAAVDPAAVPGITGPRPAEPAAAKPEPWGAPAGRRGAGAAGRAGPDSHDTENDAARPDQPA